MELKLHIKQAQQFNSVGDPVIYVGANPQVLQSVVNGILAANRQLPNYPNYIEVTNQVSDLFKLQLTWSTDYEPYGSTKTGSILPKKSSSGKITFEGDGYQYLKKWLIDDVSAPLNAISVRIEHVGCGNYEDYQISATDLSWCDSGEALCTFDVSLKQKDLLYTCIQKTLIADNWQGWFDEQPKNGKKHPRFSYCNEQRPHGLLIALWVLLALVFSIFTVIIVPIVILINLMIYILLGIIAVVNFIIAAINVIPGININPIPTTNLNPINLGDVFDSLASVFLETAGCGREHPAPLIRDYITNVCDKCGVVVTADSAPIFFSPNIQVNTNSLGNQSLSNPHYNACYFKADVKRGIRRFQNIGLFSGATNNTTDFYIPDNKPLLTLDMFLDELKALYNAEWVIKDSSGQPTLFFQRKDFFKFGGFIYDFSKTSPDYNKLITGICYEWNSNKFPASTKGLYIKDASDKPGNESLGYFNDIVSHGLTDNNPNYEGINNKDTNFGSTKFRLDGTSEDYLYDAFQVMLNVNILGILFIPIRDRIKDLIEQFADYALLLQGETCVHPKVLIWDGNSYTNAFVRRFFECNPAVAQFPNPIINSNYNITPWHIKNTAQTKVAGQGLTLPPFNLGYYTVTNLLGTFQIKRAALIMNYSMIMGIGFTNTMWDWFHWIDDPAKNPLLNQSFTARIQLCCEDLSILGVFGNPNNVNLLQKVKLPLQYYQDGVIKEITVSYDTEDTDGMYIEIKGTV